MANSGATSAANKKQKREDDKGTGILGQMARRRVWRACESCRRKKIKCDGTEPVCGQCTQTNSSCTWIQTRDRAALSRHYVQELENRLLKLESVLTQIAPNLDLTNLPNDPISLSQVQQPQQSIHPPSSAHLTSAQQPEQRPVLNPTASTDSGSNFINHSGTSGPSVPVRPSASSRHDSDEFVAEQMGTLALDDHGHLRWIGGSSTMSLIEAFRTFSADIDRERELAPSPPDSTSTPNATPNPPSANLLYFPSSLRFGKVRALPNADEVEYPPEDLCDLLVDAYFEKFHHTLPVLDSASFRSKYRRLMDMRAAAVENGTTPEPPTKSDAGFLSVVFAVFAVASRFVDDERLKTEGDDKDETGGMGTIYYERAMILYYIGATATQLAHVQAFVLLSSFLSSLNCLPQSWLLCGQAVRIAQDLGLHRSPKHLVMSPSNKETRRKVWWCVYGMDRMLAVALGRPLGIEDSDCDVELPLPIDDVDLPSFFINLYGSSPGSSASGEQQKIPAIPNPSTLMAGFISLTKLHMIFGRILRTVYAVNAVETCKENVALTQANVDRLDKELTAWCEALPAVFKSDPKSPQEVSLGAILCSSYYSALIALHRNFLPTKRRGVPNPNWSSVPKAVFASRSCILLSVTTKEAISSSHYLAFFVQALFSAAVIILLCARFATVESAARTASEEVNTALICLGRLQNAWPGAKKCKELLEELVEVTRGDMRVQVPGVGRIGSVDGRVDPTPPGVESVQTVYNSFKRAVTEGENIKVEGSINTTGIDPATGQPCTRKFKPRPNRKSIGGNKEWRASEEFSSPRSGDSTTDTVADMDFQISDSSPRTPAKQTTSADPFLSSSGSPTRPQSHSSANLNMPSLDVSMTTPDVSSQSSPVMGMSSPFGFGGQPGNGHISSTPHDWLPSPTVDAFGRMQGFGAAVEGEVFNTISAQQPPHGQPQGTSNTGSPSQQAYHSYYDMQSGSNNIFGNNSAGAFDFSSADLPFSGFDFLQTFGSNGTNGFGGNSAFGAGVGGDVATWQNFVGDGVFSDMPDQPFSSLVESGRADE
ncbi:hypothetical protein FRC03_002629 [Tulasnella sp. 419]|nr:hypothetical protein FRC03_002629 [Tulasnella sp. 419]